MFSPVEALMDATRARERLNSSMANGRVCATRWTGSDVGSSVAGGSTGPLPAVSCRSPLGRQRRVGVREQDLVGEQVAKPAVRPALDEEARDQVQIGARVDVVRDAGRDHGEDIGGAFAIDVKPGEERVLAAQDQPSQLALSVIVGCLDVAVLQEEKQPMPLAVK
jgi:hypothetical protein